MLKRFFDWISEVIGIRDVMELDKVVTRESDIKPRLAIVVGHTLNSPGATMKHPEYLNEYFYNTAVSEKILEFSKEYNIECRVFFRDGVGIRGAYRDVKQWAPHTSIELHFNAFNSKVRGTETLFYDDRDFEGVDERYLAQIVQERVCEVFARVGRQNRGIKKVGPKSRGGTNLSQLFDTPSILIEPFFGDNVEDAALAVRQIDAYAKCLVDCFHEWYFNTIIADS